MEECVVSRLACCVFVGAVLFAAMGAGTTSAATTPLKYAAGFRVAYLPVVTTLNQVTAKCASVRRVAELPACGKRVAAFRTATSHLLAYINQTTPPAKAKADVTRLRGTIKLLQRQFAKFATLIRERNLKGVLAMGGLGRPLDSSIQGFSSSIQLLDLDLPGKSLPLPG
jgi:NADH:ubiquinone oxidoreductase subunit 6 (subunit J)